MLPSRELARQKAVTDATEYIGKARTIGDLAWQVTAGLDGLRGESRIGYCVGVVNALETLAYRENE